MWPFKSRKKSEATVEEILLIHRKTGMLAALASAAGADAKPRDEVARRLAAIESFARDSFGLDDDGGLTSFSIDELEVHVRSSPDALLVAAVRGAASQRFLDKFEETLEVLNTRYSSQIRDFDGDSGTLRDALPLLVECLQAPTT